MGSLKVLLIQPSMKFMAHPPLGLLSIGAVLREKGYNIEIWDFSGKEINEKDLMKDLVESNPDIVALSVLTGPALPRAIKISKIAKGLNKIVIWGGPHPTILPRLTLENDFVDGIVIGEAENSFLNLLGYFDGKKKSALGCGVRVGKDIEIFSPSEYVDLEKLPMPAWDLLKNIDRYFLYKKHNSVTIAASRGCMYKCGFCHNSNEAVKKYLGPYRNLSAKRVLDEFEFVKSLTKKHIDRMDIGGDLHFSTSSYVETFCNDLININNNIKWNSAATISVMKDELIDLIIKAGCESIMFGIESGSDRIQNLLGKKVDLKKAKKTCGDLVKNGVLVTNTYMLGHPTETLEEVKKTLDFMKKIPASQNLLQIYRPFPGTPYYGLCIKSGKISEPKTLEECFGFGVLGSDVNMSEVSTETLNKIFYKSNFFQQSKYLFNKQKFYLKNAMFEQFFEGFWNNRFTFKLKEYIENRKEK